MWAVVKFFPATALAFFTASSSLIFSAPERGFVRLLSIKSTTGVLARRTLIGLALLMSLLLSRQILLTEKVAGPQGEGD